MSLNIPKFDATALESAVKNVIKECGYDEDVLLKDPSAKCKVFVCAVRDENHGQTVLSSYPPTRGLRNLYGETKIWEACRATSAASTFFDPITIGRFGQKFVDGGLGRNNPVKDVWLEAMDLWGKGAKNFDDMIGCFVSIGTGVPYNRQISASAISLFKALAYIATDTERIAASFERERRQLQRDHRYFRWNVDLPAMSEIGLEEEDRINEIAAATEEYFGRESRNQEVAMCAEQLLNDKLIGNSPSRRARRCFGKVAQARRRYNAARHTIDRSFRRDATRQDASPQEQEDVQKAMEEVESGLEEFEELLQSLYDMQTYIQSSLQDLEIQVTTIQGVANELEKKKAELEKILGETTEKTAELERMRDELQEARERLAESSKEQGRNAPSASDKQRAEQQRQAGPVAVVGVLLVTWVGSKVLTKGLGWIFG